MFLVKINIIHWIIKNKVIYNYIISENKINVTMQYNDNKCHNGIIFTITFTKEYAWNMQILHCRKKFYSLDALSNNEFDKGFFLFSINVAKREMHHVPLGMRKYENLWWGKTFAPLGQNFVCISVSICCHHKLMCLIPFKESHATQKHMISFRQAVHCTVTLKRSNLFLATQCPW